MPRDRLAILLMASSGVRVGALCDIKVKHLKRVDKYRIYQISVYDSEYEEYITFCTPECASAVDFWLDYRRKAGENITPESYLFRDNFDINDALRVNNPKRIKTNTIEFQIHQKLIHAGMREGRILESERRGSKRYEVRMAHGFRKFFDTTATQAGVSPLYVDMLRGKKLGLKGSYFLPTEKDILEGNGNIKGYVSAINDLTIDKSIKLQSQVDSLTQENTHYSHALEEALTISTDFLEIFWHNSNLEQIESFTQQMSKKHPQFKELLDSIKRDRNSISRASN
jgi:hypothetical protein